MTAQRLPRPLAAAARSLRSVERRYAGEEERPLGGYAGVLAAFALSAATFAGLLRASGRTLPERLETRDLLLTAVATHKLARLMAKDPVTSPIRAPFTRFAGPAGPSEVAEEVPGRGPRKAVGELLTCPFCVGHWVASALVAGLVLAPRPTRLVASVYTTLSLSDLLQFAHAAITRRTGE